jgi:hypothetical protein
VVANSLFITGNEKQLKGVDQRATGKDIKVVLRQHANCRLVPMPRKDTKVVLRQHANCRLVPMPRKDTKVVLRQHANCLHWITYVYIKK